MNNINLTSQQSDYRELARQQELKQEIANGNPFATGELNLRQNLANQGFNYEQIETAIDNFFSAPF